MIVIIGGATHGKLAFVKNHVNKNIIDCQNHFMVNDAFVLNNFHELGKRINLENFVTDNLSLLENKIIIAQEVGLGIVPLEDSLRKQRDEISRSYQILVANAEVVIRMWYQIPIYIKGDNKLYLELIEKYRKEYDYE